MIKRFLAILLSLALVLGCTVSASAAVTDGTYEVETKGMYDGLKLAVTFAEGKITDIQVIASSETEAISAAAFERVPQAIIDNNSVLVDTVGGATMTSNGIIAGVKAAIEAAGGNVADYETAVAAEAAARTEKTIETEVVVAGAGLSGLTAAITAAEAGLNVVLLEKMPQAGGSLSLAGGNFVSVNSEVAKEYGIDDNMEATMTFWQWSADQSVDKETGFPDMERVENALLKVDPLLTWMKDHGVPFYKGTDVGPQTVAKIYTEGGGSAVTKALVEAAAAAGVTILYETPAVEILMQDGAAVGLKAQSATEDITVTASKGVILATGGFGANAELVAEWVPGYAGAATRVAAADTGDGFLMAEAIGAAMYDDEWVMPSGLTLDPSITENVTDTSMFTYSLLSNRALVNEDGNRFTNEYIGGAYAVLTNAVAAEKCDVYYILDGANETEAAALEEGAEKGVIAKADTIADLAAAIGVSADNLTATIDAYNAFCSAGTDEAYAKDPAYLTAYAAEGPYYAVKFIPSLLGTIAGVVTDENSCVYDVNNSIIPNLYAAGEMSNRMYYNQVYVGAASLSLYPIAAQAAVEHILAK